MHVLPSLQDWVRSMSITTQIRIWQTRDEKLLFTSLRNNSFWHIDVNAEDDNEFKVLYRIWEQSDILQKAFPSRLAAVQAAQVSFSQTGITIDYGGFKKMITSLPSTSTQYGIPNTNIQIVQINRQWRVKILEFGYWRDNLDKPKVFSSRTKAAEAIWMHIKQNCETSNWQQFHSVI